MASTRQGYIAAIIQAATQTAITPTHFLRFKDGDINYNQSIIANNPIQANRWNPLNAVPGQIDTAGQYNIDLDPNECVYWLYSALGGISSADISSLTDTSVYRHTLTPANSIPSYTVEQGKGNLLDTSNNRQNYVVQRNYGVKVNSFTISGSDAIINLLVNLQAHGAFQLANAISDESAEAAGTNITAATWASGVATVTSTTHGLSVGDLVVIASVTPTGYNGGYRVLSIPTADTFTVAITSDPGAYTSGGTVTKQASFELDKVEGLAVGDTVNVVELTTPVNETAVVTVIDTIGKQVGFASLTETSYTVANGTKIELVPLTPSYSTAAKVFSFTHASYQFGDDLTDAATNEEINIENWEITYENNLDVRYGSLRASPSVVAERGNQAMLKFTKFFKNVEDRDRYLEQAKQAAILTITNNEIVSATDTNQAKYSIIIKMNDVRFTTYEMPTETDGTYIYNVEATCFYDSGDGAAFSIEVINPKAGTVYTA